MRGHWAQNLMEGRDPEGSLLAGMTQRWVPGAEWCGTACGNTQICAELQERGGKYVKYVVTTTNYCLWVFLSVFLPVPFLFMWQI